MFKVALVGIGFMGRGHLENYIRLESEGFPVKLTALCDVDPQKFNLESIKGNIDIGTGSVDFSRYNLYTDLDEMLEKEELDYIDIALPTYLHAETSIKVLNRGLHVLCEKPMALSVKECEAMIEASRKNNRRLMIGQCLRFWPAYEVLKEYVESRKFGEVLGGYFFRGGGTPIWSYKNWLLKKEKSGGCLLDQHVHDVDMINWLFGKPSHVSTIGRNVIKGSGYDMVSTQYIYNDGKVINAQDDWTLKGDFGFEMLYRVNFEKGNIIYRDGNVKINPNDGQGFEPELSKDDGYYREIVYFVNALSGNNEINTAEPSSTMDTIEIAECEMLSADRNGEKILVP